MSTPIGSVQTLAGLLERAAHIPDTGLRLLDRSEKATWHSWREIYQSSLRVAGGLRKIGLRQGECVSLVFPTGIDFFHAFFGTLLAGGVPVPVYPPVRLGRLTEYHHRTARMFELVRARLVLADGRVRRVLGEAVRLAAPPLGCLRLGDLPQGLPCEGGLELGTETLALVQFSSGTTMDPKPVALSNKAILVQVRLLNSFWPATSKDSTEGTGWRPTGVSWLPLYHDMGLIGCIFTALEIPSVLTLIPPEVFVTRPATWLRALSKYRATVSPAPNFAYGLCVKKIRDEELEGVDLSSWKVALNGAEPVSPVVLRRFLDRFAPFGLDPAALTPVYGLAEAALAVSFSDLETPFSSRRFARQPLASEGQAVEKADGIELVSVGRPLPEFEIAIRDRDGLALPEAQTGRLWVRGPSLMDGYLFQPEATRRAVVDGWLDTGDLGFSYRGELFLTGRAKDMILLRGRNFAPQTIEQSLDLVPAVRTGCTVAVSRMPEGGEQEELILLVETTPEATGEEKARLPELCNKAVLAAVGVLPDQVVLLEPGTLPRTSSGKLRRQEALRLYLAEALEASAQPSPLGLALALGRSSLAFARHRRKPRKASWKSADDEKAGR